MTLPQIELGNIRSTNDATVNSSIRNTILKVGRISRENFHVVKKCYRYAIARAGWCEALLCQ
jgi:hypothetical protein